MINRVKSDLTDAEVRHAHRRHIFTVTSETPCGYFVTCLRLPRTGPPVVLSRSRECVRPSTARRYGARLVRAALGDGGK
jgi:hypothetical protein